jgi:hypothetical protein
LDVKQFDEDKGFGFVNCRDEGQDIMVRISEIDTKPIHDADNTDLKPERVAIEEGAGSRLDPIFQLSGRLLAPEKGRM